MCTTLTLWESTEVENIFSEEEKKFWDVQIIIVLHLRKEGGVLHLCNITLLLAKFEIIICWQYSINYNDNNKVQVTKWRGDLLQKNIKANKQWSPNPKLYSGVNTQNFSIALYVRKYSVLLNILSCTADTNVGWPLDSNMPLPLPTQDPPPP